MTRVYKITDGTASVEMAAWSTSGFSAQRGGLGPSTVLWDLPVVPSRRLGNVSLSDFSAQPVIERFVLNVRDSSQTAVANKLTTLIKLLQKAMRFMSPDFPKDTTPVYLERTPTGMHSSYPQYALIVGCLELSYPDLFRTPFEVNNEAEGVVVSLIRVPYWSNHAPGVLPSRPELQNKVWGAQLDDWFPITNICDGLPCTHIFTYDTSAATYSSNLLGSNNVNLLPNPVGVGDCFYAGSGQGVWHTLLMELDAYFEGTSVSGVWEYYNGAWVSLGASWTWPDNFFSDPTWEFGSAGGGVPVQDEYSTALKLILSWFGNPDWTTVSVNGITAYWIRFRVTAATGVTSLPNHNSPSGKGMHANLSDYIQVPDDQILGDSPATLRLKMKAMGQENICSPYINRVTVAIKSRGLTNFYPKINLGRSPSTAPWTSTTGTDTSQGSYLKHTGVGRQMYTTFATTATEAVRLRLYIQDSTNAEDFRGKYHLKLIGQQVGGAAGDIEVKLSVNTTSRADPATWESDWVAFAGAGNEAEVLDMGTVTIPSGDFDPTEALKQLSISISARRNTGSATMYLYELWPIPIDEFSLVLDDPQLPSDATPPVSSLDTYYSSGIHNGVKYLILDTGVMTPFAHSRITSRSGSAVPATAETVLANWITRGEPKGIDPDGPLRIYFFIESLKDDGAGGGRSGYDQIYIAPVFHSFMVSAWLGNRWLGPRGTT